MALKEYDMTQRDKIGKEIYEAAERLEKARSILSDINPELFVHIARTVQRDLDTIIRYGPSKNLDISICYSEARRLISFWESILTELDSLPEVRDQLMKSLSVRFWIAYFAGLAANYDEKIAELFQPV